MTKVEQARGNCGSCQTANTWRWPRRLQRPADSRWPLGSDLGRARVLARCEQPHDGRVVPIDCPDQLARAAPEV